MFGPGEYGITVDFDTSLRQNTEETFHKNYEHVFSVLSRSIGDNNMMYDI